MSDLIGGGGPAASNGHGNGHNNDLSSGRTGPARSNVASPLGIRGPKAIMQQRAEREARQREERERLKRVHLETEARLQEDAARREAERRAAEGAPEHPTESRRATAAGVGPSAPGRPIDPVSTRPTGDNNGRTGGSKSLNVSLPTRNEAGPSRPGQSIATPGGPGVNLGQPTGPQPPAGEFSAAIGRGRSAFPHAFERWETLSAHWEGLTSFWIRRLEQNASEIQGDPIAQQLSRQVTDLSSAGANLFHAVVELQRLRASSERKFQRWFYEMRDELERNHEVSAMLEASLEEERRSRADAIRQAVDNEQGSSKLYRQLAEMRKELSISKEEARRAWEELGRREQEERDRITSLQLGQPTIVGGVQVVPMNQGVNRVNTQRDPRYAQQDVQDFANVTSSRSTRAEQSQAPAVGTITTSGGPIQALQTPASVTHQQSYASEGTMSEEGFETPGTQPGVHVAPVSVPQPSYPPTADYSGSGFSATGWEEMPQHGHEASRLSDVLEVEEDGSRTSASQLGRH